MDLFTPPKTSYKSYYKQGAFNLTWKANALFILIFPFLILAGIFSSLFDLLISSFCMLVPICSRWWLKKTLRYEFVGYAEVGIACILPGVLLNLHLFPITFTEFLFMIASIIYSFIALRRKTGIVVSAIQLAWVVLFIFNQPEKPIDLTTFELIIAVIPVLVGFVVVCFLIVSFLEQRKEAELKFVETNENLKDANKMVSAQNKEKTVMLKEIHHRVKNNLQVISSLLRLQSYEIDDEASKAHFQNAVHRVAAMALIHEKMYQNENLSKINLTNYVDTLAKDLVRNHARGAVIDLDVYSEIEDLGNDTLVPVALILNELITNSLKHAFKGQAEGKISVKIQKVDKPGYFSFIYRDSGTWQRTTKSNSFGLELITTLIEQLDGDVERTYEEGTKYTFILRDLLRDLK